MPGGPLFDSNVLQSTPQTPYSILAPVLLLIVVELSQVARHIDLQDAIENDHQPLILNAIASPAASIIRFGILTLRVVTPTWVLKRVPSTRHHKYQDRLSKISSVLLPRLGRFTVIHTTNSGMLILGMYVTQSTMTDFNVFASGPTLFFIALVILPIFEVSEYDLVLQSEEDNTSFFVNMYFHFLFFIVIFESVDSPKLEHFLSWLLITSYLYVVALALDIGNIEGEETEGEYQYRGIE